MNKYIQNDRNIWVYILLTFVTCGIYSIYFWYRYTEDINLVCDGDGNESPNYIIVFLLSLVTFSIYGFYWYYKQGNRLQAIAPSYGLNFQENGTSVLLWMLLGSFLCGIGTFVGMHILMKNMNDIAEPYNMSVNNF